MDSSFYTGKHAFNIILTGMGVILLSGCGGGGAEAQTPPSASTTNTSSQSGSAGSPGTVNPVLSSGSRYSLVSSRGTVIETLALNPERNTYSDGSTGTGSLPASKSADTYTPPEPIDERGEVAQRILGNDERFPVYTQAYPYRATARITYNGTSYCTGWLVSKDTLVTAGHCIHDGGSTGNWRTPASLRIYPGFADGYAPYGSCGAREIYSSYAWVTQANSDADVGVIKLDCAIGNSTGYFSYLVTTPGSTDLLTISGYPGDKAGGQQQWASHGYLSFATPGKLYYDNDTYSGMSGAPLWLENGNITAQAVALHTSSTYTVDGESNAGTRISQEVFDLISAASKLP